MEGLMTRRHPDELDLDTYRLGQSSDEVAEHLAECDRCAEQLDLLCALEAELSAQPPAIEVPENQDRALRAAAAERAAAIAPRPSRRPWIAAALAAAAAVVLLFTLRGVFEGGDQVARAPAIAGDVNGDGTLDVIDAMVLARELDSPASPAAWDVDGSGAVDQADVDWIARRAVTVKEVGR